MELVIFWAEIQRRTYKLSINMWIVIIFNSHDIYIYIFLQCMFLKIFCRLPHLTVAGLLNPVEMFTTNK